MFIGAFALSTLEQPWCAVPAAICSVLLGVGAITGWCPTDLLSRGTADTSEPNSLGYPEALQKIETD